MEKKSKALIIAAAILLAIAIVGIGMYIFRSTDVTQTIGDTATKMQIEQFNLKYQMYEGRQKGRIVKTLLNLASQDNETLYEAADTVEFCVCIRSNDKSLLDSLKENSDMITALNGTRSYGVRYPSSITEISNNILNSKTYNIWFNYNDYGYICEINIDTI